MKNKILWISLALLPALAGCGGEDLSSASGSVTPGQLTTMAPQLNAITQKLLGDDDGTSANDPSNLFTGGGAPVSAGAPITLAQTDACRTFVVKDTTDADSDGAQKHVKSTFNCKSLSDGGDGTMDILGSTEVIDYNDSKKGEFAYFYNVHQNNSNEDVLSWTGESSFKSQGRDLVQSSDFSFHSKSDRYLPIKLDFIYRAKYEFIRTPTSATEPYEAGKTNFKGFYQFAGFIGRDDKGKDLGNVSIVFEIEGKGLIYKMVGAGNPCTNYYQAGSVSFIDGARNTYKIEYTCTGEPTVTFNGQPYED